MLTAHPVNESRTRWRVRGASSPARIHSTARPALLDAAPPYLRPRMNGPPPRSTPARPRQPRNSVIGAPVGSTAAPFDGLTCVTSTTRVGYGSAAHKLWRPCFGCKRRGVCILPRSARKRVHRSSRRRRASYKAARDSDRCYAAVFYERLFAAAPATQREKLDAIIVNLETPDANAEMLRTLGRRRSSYGARPEHYELVAILLADTIVELSAGAASRRLVACDATRGQPDDVGRRPTQPEALTLGRIHA